ncbi:MAG: hypothetical protein LBK99_26410, partial [Opitutaceae bacterium]|nr:hypothetical protein [Opitutaceae bacterium]
MIKQHLDKRYLTHLLAFLLLLPLALATQAAASQAAAASAASPSAAPAEGAQISLHATIPGDSAKTPALVGLRVEQTVEIKPSNVSSTAKIKATVLNGKTDTVSLRISQKTTDEFEIIRAEGENVRDWALRQSSNGESFFDVRLKKPLEKGKTAEATLFFSRWTRIPAPKERWTSHVPVLSAGDESGVFDGVLRILRDEFLQVTVTPSPELVPVGAEVAAEGEGGGPK